MNDNQGHDFPNVATLNVTDITNVKHLRLSDNDQGESSSGSTPTTIINSVPWSDEIGTLKISHIYYIVILIMQA